MTADKQLRFPCDKCGAMLKFAPGVQTLSCHYCGQQSQIAERFETIQEYDFHKALKELANAPASIPGKQAKCDACGAQFKFEQNVHSGECPFCGTTIVTGTGKQKSIKPKSLLPFSITQIQAQMHFKQWLQGLWFVPGKVKQYSRRDNKLQGIYVPHWTYDSHTETNYIGERGDIYYVNQRIRVREGNRMVSRVKRVAKIRWSPARGYVNRFFDDVLVGASRSLPRKITDNLQPWDLPELIPYDEAYLSGFSSEIYQVDLDEGFALAREIMDSIIYRDIMQDIGGDHQRIHHADTRHSRTTFKHCLLPLWSAAFNYRKKTYRFVINGRTGKVQGERPYSYWKIAFAVLGVGIMAGGLYLLMDKYGVLENVQYQQGYSYQYRY